MDTGVTFLSRALEEFYYDSKDFLGYSLKAVDEIETVLHRDIFPISLHQTFCTAKRAKNIIVRESSGLGYRQSVPKKTS
jgi:hypothetical protein